MSSAPGFPRPRRLAVLALAVALAAAACEPEPTPLPVLPVATTPAPEITAEAGARAHVLVDALTLRLLPAEARARLDVAAEVVEVDALPEPLDGAALSVLPFAGGAPTPYQLIVAADLNTEQPPLNNPELASALADAMVGGSGGNLRLVLANAGYPDGFTLTVAVDPGLWEILEPSLVRNLPLQWFPVAEGTPAMMALGAGADADRLLEAGGSTIGRLPVYAKGVLMDEDADGLPVFALSG